MALGDRVPGNHRLGDLVSSVLAALSAAVVLVVATTVSHADVAVVVPNAYNCSKVSDTCTQTNPPNAPTAPNQCTWVASRLPAGVPAGRVC